MLTLPADLFSAMKRGGDREDARRGPKQARTTRFGQHAFKVLCADKLVARLMGDKTTGVHHIEEKTKTHLQFTPRGEYFPGTPLRVLNIYGREAAHIFNSLECIVDTVENLIADDPRGAEEHMDREGRMNFMCTLAKSSAGAVIGNKGASIKALREQTGAHIDIVREHFDDHQQVTIQGSREQVMEVLESLNNTVQAEVDKPWFTAWADQLEISGDGGDHRGQRHGGGGGGVSSTSFHDTSEEKDCTVFVGRLSQKTDSKGLERYFSQYGHVTHSDVRMDPETGRSKGFGFITYARASMAEDCLASGRDRPHVVDDRRVDVKRYIDEPNDGRAEEYFPQYDGSNHGGFAGIEWFSEQAADIPQEYLNMEYSINFSLPNAKCGPVIGRGGEHLKEVERISGAGVTIEKVEKNRNQEEGFRTVTINGSLLSVYSAHMNLMRYYNDHETRQQVSKNDDGGDVEDLKRQVAFLKEQLQNKQMEKGGPRVPTRGRRSR
jgi:transcription antitermination factor NusA-like protein